MNCGINAIDKVLLRFYMFKGERLQNDYIKECELRICIAMQKRNWDDNIHCTKCDFSNKSTSSNRRWAWISCDFRSNKTSTFSWIRHNHIPNYTFHTL